MSETTQNIIPDTWTTADAEALYAINDWSDGNFAINKEGEVIVKLDNGEHTSTVSLYQIAEGLKQRGMDMPVLLRICDILSYRIRQLNTAFADAIKQCNYQNIYRGVFPIKVNQQAQVIEEISSFGGAYGHGLEAGSKAELIAAIPHLVKRDALLICNGYKDEEFFDMGLYARKIGVNCIFVIETTREIPIVIARAKALGIKPVLGVRIKLSTKAGGHWDDSGGDRSVFGLNAQEVVQLVEQLREADMLDCLQMLHYHLGSQLPNIRNIRLAATEACRFYVGLVEEGAPMGILDLGGGLAVDYDGSHTSSISSKNYSLAEYCVDLLEEIMSVLNPAEIPHPMIVTESGRATVAHYSVLLFNILDVTEFRREELPDKPPENLHEQVKYIIEVARVLKQQNMQECYHDAIFYRDAVRQLFKHGITSLRERALAEQVFWNIMNRIYQMTREMGYVPEELEGIERQIADIYYGNFSLFQSLPDSWAIEQLFPIMPIHRLGERPTREAVFSDITCDCEGKVDSFVTGEGIRHTLPLHKVGEEEYYLGVFLVGAYQETLGDLHNLFGDTHVVSVELQDDGTVDFTKETEGDTVADVLSMVEYNTKDLISAFRKLAERAVKDKLITAAERKQIVDYYEAGLRGYTYYES